MTFLFEFGRPLPTAEMHLKCCGTQVLDYKGVYCSAHNAVAPSGRRRPPAPASPASASLNRRRRQRRPRRGAAGAGALAVLDVAIAAFGGGARDGGGGARAPPLAAAAEASLSRTRPGWLLRPLAET
jgi:hypothetical protein